jgi:hypothetical protein
MRASTQEDGKQKNVLLPSNQNIGRHVGLRGQIPGQIYTDLRNDSLGGSCPRPSLLMDLNDNKAINGSLRI